MVRPEGAHERPFGGAVTHDRKRLAEPGALVDHPLAIRLKQEFPALSSRHSSVELGSRSAIGHGFGKRFIRLVYCQQNRGLGARHSAGACGGTERGRADMIRQIRN